MIEKLPEPIVIPSKSSINRAGRALSTEIVGEGELKSALKLLNQWRLLHNYPINTFQATLRKRLTSIDSGAFVAQRLKRAPSIIAKLKRFDGMNLARMQDIGGVRGVVSKMNQLREIQSSYLELGRFDHDLESVADYVNSPKRDGYRSIHLVFRYKNSANAAYDGLRVEVQLRTKLQHAWATAVETMGTFLGQTLKARQGGAHWLRFFELTSSAFAYLEGEARVPGWEGLTYEETCLAVRQAELQLGVIDKLQGFSIAIKQISGDNEYSRKYFYHVVVLDSLKHEVQMIPFAEYEFRLAAEEYENWEKLIVSGQQIEVFLVSAGPIASLKKAYPNFFMDTGLFIRRVTKLIAVGNDLRRNGNRKKLKIPKGQGYLDL